MRRIASRPTRSATLLGAFLALGVAAPPASADQPAAPADSVVARREGRQWVIDRPVVVVASAGETGDDPAATRLDAIALASGDVHAAADLAPALPATRLVVNSRGEAQFMVRGASERHVRLWLDGIPLNVPWDERVDASLVPVDAIGSARLTRGAGVLDGLNALAGTIVLRPLAAAADGHRTRLGAEVGESRLGEVRLLHQRRAGAWEWLAAGSYRTRDGFVTPADLGPAGMPRSSRQRVNSDLVQGSALVRLQRHAASGATWHLTALETSGEKGVPPELHLGPDARFWRYPAARRGLIGAGVRAPLDAGDLWTLAADASVDVHHLEIRAFDDATYATPPVAPGSEYETDDDRTLFGRVRVSRRGEGTTVSVQIEDRITRHREALTWDGPTLDYAQNALAAAAEVDARLGRGWRARVGAGWDVASTPESGDKPARATTSAPAASARIERPLGAAASWHASYARRSRFPALRELYSGALGRFVPNPDLAPEVQDLWEVGVAGRGGGWTAGVTAFASWLEGAIERVALPDDSGRFQRVNLDRVRTLGVELVASWRPHAAWEFAGHHAALAARRRAGGAYAGAVEDRPAYVSYLSAAWSGPAGLRAAADVALLGPRSSADVTDPEDGLRRLPAQGAVGLRLAKVVASLGPLTRGEVYLRVDNLLDAVVESQTGLPQAGRTVAAGFQAWFESWPP